MVVIVPPLNIIMNFEGSSCPIKRNRQWDSLGWDITEVRPLLTFTIPLLRPISSPRANALGGINYGLFKIHVDPATLTGNWNYATEYGIYAHSAISAENINRSPVSGGVGVMMVFGYNRDPYRASQVDITESGIALRTCMGSNWSPWVVLASVS